MGIQIGNLGSWARRRLSSTSNTRTRFIFPVITRVEKCSPHRFDNGINTFDTANAYSNGESERVLGKALKYHQIPREEIVILTKVYLLLSSVVN